jgi:hypothetical protein
VAERQPSVARSGCPQAQVYWSPCGQGCSIRSWQPHPSFVQVRTVPVSLFAMQLRYPGSGGGIPAAVCERPTVTVP